MKNKTELLKSKNYDCQNFQRFSRNLEGKIKKKRLKKIDLEGLYPANRSSRNRRERN